MLCERLSLLTNRTRVPGDTVICVALTPDAVMVMVVVPPPPPPGDEGEPPHAASAMSTRSGHDLRTSGLSHPPSLDARLELRRAVRPRLAPRASRLASCLATEP